MVRSWLTSARACSWPASAATLSNKTPGWRSLWLSAGGTAPLLLHPLPGLGLVSPAASLGPLHTLHESILRHTEVPRSHARDAPISRRSQTGELSSSADRE